MGWQIRFDGTLRDISDEDLAEELKKDPFASRWEGGIVVDVDDLSPDQLDAIAAAEDTSWYQIYASPATSSARLQRLIEACANHAGIELPGPPKTVGEFKDRYENWLEATRPIEEKPFENGFPPMPGDQETGSPSGSPGISDGRSTSPDDNPSTTS